MDERSEKRVLVWDEMQVLQDAGLGRREIVSPGRDKFMLDAEHQAAHRLSDRPDANGFIRADEKTLLFRDASDELRKCLSLPDDLSFPSEKGAEFRWKDLDHVRISRMFESLRRLALP